MATSVYQAIYNSTKGYLNKKLGPLRRADKHKNGYQSATGYNYNGKQKFEFSGGKDLELFRVTPYVGRNTVFQKTDSDRLGIKSIDF